MSHPQRRCIGALVVAALTLTPALRAGEPAARSGARVEPGALGVAWQSAAQPWQTLLAFWIPFGQPAGSARHRSHRGSGFGPTPTCDNGGSLDPNGHCVKTSPICDGGGSLDPSGHCVTTAPACDAGGSLDPNGKCPTH
jgi:hypothetical protein